MLVTTIGLIAGFDLVREALGTGYRGVVEQDRWRSPISSVFVSDQLSSWYSLLSRPWS
jgi:hypothetical protein